EQRGSRQTIDVVVAVDGDGLALRDRPSQPRRRLRNPVHRTWIAELASLDGIEERRGFALRANATVPEELPHEEGVGADLSLLVFADPWRDDPAPSGSGWSLRLNQRRVAW